MRVAVTGAGGFLGAATVRSLRASGYDVVGVTRREVADEGFVRCDLSDPAAVVRLLPQLEADAVVNLAARVAPAGTTAADLYAVNVLCPAILADHCRVSGAPLVQASSISVHGARAARIDEATPETPTSPYGFSKLAAEKVIQSSGCRAAIIRFGGIFGREGPDHLGLNRAITAAATRGEVPVVVGSGAARRNYVHVDDAATMIERALAEGLEGVFRAGGETRSILEMLQAVCDVWLPGQRPVETSGPAAPDQVVRPSPELGEARAFGAALEGCR